MVTWLYLICALLTCLHVAMWCQGRRASRLLAGLPSYTRVPFLGNIHKVFGGGEFIFSLLVEMSEVIEETLKPFVFWVGPSPIVLVSDPEDVKAVTNAFIEKPYFYNFGRVWLGDGLVTAPGSVWKRSIKRLAGTFTGNIVDGYQDVFNAQAQKLVDQLRADVGGEPFDIMHKYLAFTTLEAICQTALGVARISESVVTTEYYRAFNRTLELFIRRGINLLHHPDLVYRSTAAYRELLECVAVLHKVSDTVMKKRKKEREEMKLNGTLDQNTPEDGKARFKAFLDILLELGDKDPTLSEQQIKSEVDTIIVGGQETVATTMFYAFLMIGCKPGVQDKLYAEVRDIFGDTKRAVKKEDLVRMRYCEAVINETLRMFPPVPGVMRLADRDLPLKSCTIPKGTACFVNAFGAGRSRRAWGADALEFRPERWLEEPAQPAQAAAFLAFSYGKRACIGKKYAMAFLKTVIAYCVRELVFVSEADKLELKLDVALRAVSGHLIEVRLRR